MKTTPGPFLQVIADSPGLIHPINNMFLGVDNQFLLAVINPNETTTSRIGRIIRKRCIIHGNIIVEPVVHPLTGDSLYLFPCKLTDGILTLTHKEITIRCFQSGPLVISPIRVSSIIIHYLLWWNFKVRTSSNKGYYLVCNSFLIILGEIP